MSDTRGSRISSSTPPIRALLRCLDALTMRNLRGAATAAEVASQIDVPDTAIYRILESLAAAGFLERTRVDERNRPTPVVHPLADGADDAARLTQAARPLLFALCREIDWRVAIATPSGSTMRVRATTEQPNATKTERYSAACQIPMQTTASGAVREISLATPVLETREVAATLTERCERSRLPLEQALERFLPALRRTAERIGARLLTARSFDGYRSQSPD